ncbi:MULTISPECIES: hypothetical protein [unclassified Streptomyces]|uniref:hypothetical protein n=1 Tax=unclassified Streptomyces TaxID=2593676 RepID=UPI003D9351C7
MAALSEDLSDTLRIKLLTYLIRCVGGESHWTEVEAGAPEIELDCQIAAREGIWSLYQEYATGRADMARIALELVDNDPERFAHFDAKLIGRFDKRMKRARR